MLNVAAGTAPLAAVMSPAWPVPPLATGDYWTAGRSALLLDGRAYIAPAPPLAPVRQKKGPIAKSVRAPPFSSSSPSSEAHAFLSGVKRGGVDGVVWVFLPPSAISPPAGRASPAPTATASQLDIAAKWCYVVYKQASYK